MEICRALHLHQNWPQLAIYWDLLQGAHCRLISLMSVGPADARNIGARVALSNFRVVKFEMEGTSRQDMKRDLYLP